MEQRRMRAGEGGGRPQGASRSGPKENDGLASKMLLYLEQPAKVGGYQFSILMSWVRIGCFSKVRFYIFHLQVGFYFFYLNKNIRLQ